MGSVANTGLFIWLTEVPAQTGVWSGKTAEYTRESQGAALIQWKEKTRARVFKCCQRRVGRLPATVLRGRKCDTVSIGIGCCGAMLTPLSSSISDRDQFTFS